MKRFNWLLIGFTILCLAMVLLAGCVSQSEYEALQAEYATLQSDLTDLQADYEAVSDELAEIKEVYPPRDFSSLSELQDWLLENDVSGKPITTYADAWYGRALEIQEDALIDGYIVSAEVFYDENTELFSVTCTTIINGDLWWWDPETDEPIQWYMLGKVK